MPLGCIICTALIVSRPLVYPYANGNFGHSRVVSIYYSVGLLSLLASTNRAIPTSLRTWSERQCRASRFLFVFIVLIYNTLGCRSPRPLANGCYGYRSRHIGGLYLPILSRPIDHPAQRPHHEQGGRATAQYLLGNLRLCPSGRWLRLSFPHIPSSYHW